MDKRDLTMMFKVVKYIAPNYLTNMFRKFDNSNHSYTEQQFKIEPSQAKNRFSKKKLLLVGLSLGIVYPLNLYEW